MLEIVKGLPDNVIGIVDKGRVTNEECESVLRPALQASLKRHVRPRLYYESIAGFRAPDGPIWRSVSTACRNGERVAVVTDTAWVRQTVNALRFLLAGEVRVFTSFEMAEGRAWITSPGRGDNERRFAAVTAPPAAPPPLPWPSPSRSRRPSSRPTRRGGRRYRRPSAGGR